ncbi:MAG: trypsin-like peptidase domain-containing protein [Pannonibacter sp.]
MIAFLRSCLICLLIALPAQGQALGPRERSAIGIVEISILPPEDEPGPPKREQGTGVIVSSSGDVLTAYHLFDKGRYETCASSANGETGETCEISFYLRGSSLRKYALTLSSGKVEGLDYVLLKLPAPEDVLDEDETWPFLFFGAEPKSQDPLTGAGYARDTPPGKGPNPVKSFTGNYSPVVSPACDPNDGAGYSTKLLARSEPGNSGGPVLDARGRLVGLVLGRGCETGSEAAPFTRILPIARIPGLCERVDCLHGFPGFISKRSPGTSTPWQDRLDGTGAAPQDIEYGVQLSVMSLFPPPTAIACAAFFADMQAYSKARADAESGGELANVLLANYALCSGLVPSQEADAANKRVKDLAEQGYEPAQPLAAWLLMKDKFFGIAPGETVGDFLSQWERDDLDRAQKYLTEAADGGWASAIYMKAVNCRLKLVDCETTYEDLKAAADLGQLDARREIAVLQLIGEDPASTFVSTIGFSLPKNTQLALQALHRNAAAQGMMSGKYPYWDPLSAAHLAYLYGGGLHNGEKLVTPNLQQSVAYEGNCYSGPLQYQNPLHRACWFFGLVARFNFANTPQVRGIVKANFQQDAGSTDVIGNLTSNIVMWLEHDPSITKIQCELASDFSFKEMDVVTPLPAKTASCYFRPPTPE